MCHLNSPASTHSRAQAPVQGRLCLLMAEASSDVKPDVKPAGPSVTIKLRASDNTTTAFKVKGKTSFRKIVDTYSKKMGKEATSLIFIFDGERIDSHLWEKSISDLGMEDGDVVDVNTLQVGGA
jgi:small ubiquitin-related modifier